MIKRVDKNNVHFNIINCNCWVTFEIEYSEKFVLFDKDGDLVCSMGYDNSDIKLDVISRSKMGDELEFFSNHFNPLEGVDKYRRKFAFMRGIDDDYVYDYLDEHNMDYFDLVNMVDAEEQNKKNFYKLLLDTDKIYVCFIDDRAYEIYVVCDETNEALVLIEELYHTKKYDTSDYINDLPFNEIDNPFYEDEKIHYDHPDAIDDINVRPIFDDFSDCIAVIEGENKISYGMQVLSAMLRRNYNDFFVDKPNTIIYLISGGGNIYYIQDSFGEDFIRGYVIYEFGIERRTYTLDELQKMEATQNEKESSVKKLQLTKDSNNR